ncbi:GNAT family N-acetyltransferase [Synechococcus sp. RSCCF101]|uniref:GNAT family N-acetyltransferase n=1 Tax=Synechococcus sp. RSCCF101 TaxID=2511069 RepID=UPI0012475143|nr:GNAT family N-acetyltransferase [Synechococcus sp. RSCCF101]QEY31141.1 GNAT family N-acetyltransferase [Synechococcus sp. RSCCF101]
MPDHHAKWQQCREVHEVIRVAPLEPEDLAACLALDADAMGGFWSEAQWREELTATGRLRLGARCGEDPLLLGAATAWRVLDELHLTLVLVRSAWRRQGIARRLITALLERAREEGAAHATLEVAGRNTAARGLYGELLFREAGRRRGYYRNGDDALILWRRLD